MKMQLPSDRPLACLLWSESLSAVSACTHMEKGEIVRKGSFFLIYISPSQQPTCGQQLCTGTVTVERLVVGRECMNWRVCTALLDYFFYNLKASFDRFGFFFFNHSNLTEL